MKTPIQIIDDMIEIELNQHLEDTWNKYQEGRFDALQEAKERIQTETGWISVEDKLPEQFDDVLVYGDKWMCVDNLGNRHTYKNGFSRHMDVTHWIPLPLPPNE